MSRPSNQARLTAAGRAGLGAWALVVLALSGCVFPGTGARFKGREPTRPALVDSITLPEVRPGQPDRMFAFRASPGHVLFVYFGFVNCPDVCPTTLADLRQALAALGPDARRVEVAFVTVDLNRDVPEVLVPYLGSFVDDGHALRPANQAQLGRAEAAFGATSTVAKQPDGTIEVSHTPTSYLVSDQGRVVLEWRFGTPAEDMVHDLRLLLARPAHAASPAANPAETATPPVAVTGAWARSSPAMAAMGAAYLSIESPTADRLLAASVPASIAARTELHEVVTDAAGQMKMQRADGIDLPAHVPVLFEPGSLHIMFVDLARPLTVGDTLALTLRFEKAGAMTVSVPVRGL